MAAPGRSVAELLADEPAPAEGVFEAAARPAAPQAAAPRRAVRPLHRRPVQQPRAQRQTGIERLRRALGGLPSPGRCLSAPQAQHAAAVPEDAHEYHARKALNDAAFRSLRYVPFCSTMPVTRDPSAVRWMWTRKDGGAGGAGGHH